MFRASKLSLSQSWLRGETQEATQLHYCGEPQGQPENTSQLPGSLPKKGASGELRLYLDDQLSDDELQTIQQILNVSDWRWDYRGFLVKYC